MAFIITGCGARNYSDESPDGRISVFTSFYAMYDFTSKIGGDKIRLTNLVPSGVEPHDWEPKTSDMAGLERADVFVYNGAGMEGWVDRVLSSIKNKKLIAVDASKGLNLLENEDKSEKLRYDPHVWLNPMFAKKQMEAIKNALASADPKNRDYYEKNYSDNAAKLDELDRKYRGTLSKCSKKDVIVAHQAFSYLCAAYGLRQVAIEGLSADSEPTPARMAEISRFARENNVRVIFFEELISPKVADAIANEVGAKTMVLNPLEGLKKEDIKAGKEYFSVMEDNLAALKEALQ